MKIFTKKAPNPIGPYSQAIKIKNLLFISGQIPINKNNQVPKKIFDQTILSLKNIKKIIESSKMKIKNIIKTTIFTTQINKINIINKAYKNFFLKNNTFIFPARSCIEVNKLPKNVNIEIEAIAFKKK